MPLFIYGNIIVSETIHSVGDATPQLDREHSDNSGATDQPKHNNSSCTDCRKTNQGIVFRLQTTIDIPYIYFYTFVNVLQPTVFVV